MSLRWKISVLVLVSLCCWEIIVRLFVLSPAKEVFDPDLGYVHAPYAEILRTYEGYARFSLDKFGLNNDPLPDPLPRNRVLVVGDSFVESYQVMRHENFVSRLGEQWHDTLLFNAGASATAPDMALAVLERFQPEITPTHLLLGINASDLYELLRANDIRNSKGVLKSLQRSQDAMTDFKALKLSIYAHSALITHLKWKYENEVREWLAESDGRSETKKKRELSEDKLAKAIERWRFVLQQLQLSGARVSVLMMPELDYLAPRQARLAEQQSRVILAREAELMGVPVLDSNLIMARDFEQTGLPAIGFANTSYGRGHINAHGHQVLASWLASQREVILR